MWIRNDTQLESVGEYNEFNLCNTSYLKTKRHTTHTNIEVIVFGIVFEFRAANLTKYVQHSVTQSRLPSSLIFNHISGTILNLVTTVIRFSGFPGRFYLYVRHAHSIFQGHPAVATAGNDDEDENVDVEGDAETTMYDIVYGGGSSGWHGQQPHNRMRQQPMLMHAGGYNRGKTRSVFSDSCYKFFHNFSHISLSIYLSVSLSRSLSPLSVLTVVYKN